MMRHRPKPTRRYEAVGETEWRRQTDSGKWQSLQELLGRAPVQDPGPMLKQRPAWSDGQRDWFAGQRFKRRVSVLLLQLVIVVVTALLTWLGVDTGGG